MPIAVARSDSEYSTNGFRQENAGIIHQRIDAAEAVDRRADDTAGGFGVGYVTGDGQQVRRRAGLDRPGICHDAIPPV